MVWKECLDMILVTHYLLDTILNSWLGWDTEGFYYMACFVRGQDESNPVDCKIVVFGPFRKAGRAVSVILECEARVSHYSHHSPSPFLHSLQTFHSNMVRRSRSQKIRLFCSLQILCCDWLLKRLSCPLRTTRHVLQEKYPWKPYNKSFFDQVCSVRMALYRPRCFASLWASTSSWSINLASIQPSWPCFGQ